MAAYPLVPRQSSYNGAVSGGAGGYVSLNSGASLRRPPPARLEEMLWGNTAGHAVGSGQASPATSSSPQISPPPPLLGLTSHYSNAFGSLIPVSAATSSGAGTSSMAPIRRRPSGSAAAAEMRSRRPVLEQNGSGLTLGAAVTPVMATDPSPVTARGTHRPSTSPSRRAAHGAALQSTVVELSQQRGRVPLSMSGSSLSLSMSNAGPPAPPLPVFYASTQTFLGDDVHHSSNASFNKQLQLVKQRLQEQRRVAQHNVQQQQQQLQQLQQQLQNSPRLSGMATASSLPPYFSSISAFPSAAASNLPTQLSGHIAADGYHSVRQQHRHQHSHSAQLRPAQVAHLNNAAAGLAPPHPPHPASATPRVAAGVVHSRSGSHSSRVVPPPPPYPSPFTPEIDEPAGYSGHAGHHRNYISSSSDEDELLITQGRLLPRPTRRRGKPRATAREEAAAAAVQPIASSAMAIGSASFHVVTAPTSVPAHSQVPTSAQHIQVPASIRPLPRQRNQPTPASTATTSSTAASTAVPKQQQLHPPKPLWPSLPLSGTHFPLSLIPPRPALSQVVASYLEPLNVCADRAALVRRLRAADEAKQTRQAQFGCHVVYDCIDPAPSAERQQQQQQPSPFASSDLPTSRALQDPAQQQQWGLSSSSGHPLAPFYVPLAGGSDTTLVFESRFESGNLRRAIQVGEFEYDLLIRPDINTSSFAQWFMFSVRNTRRGAVYKFNICGLNKSDSLYNDGMQPLFYSTLKARDSHSKQRHCPYQHHPPHLLSAASAFGVGGGGGVGGNGGGGGSGEVAFLPPMAAGAIGWYRAGFDVAYYRCNNAPGAAVGGGNGAGSSGKSAAAGSKSKAQYTLSFSVQCEYDNDLLYVTYTYPYTLTMLYRQLDALQCLPAVREGSALRQRVLCHSIAGNPVPLLIITDFTSPASDIAARQAVVLTARVHPGETNSSWMMQGIINFLLQAAPSPFNSSTGAPADPLLSSSPAAVAAFLRRRFVFFLVPLLNPDGVVNGNYRCSLAGVDLNRGWTNPDPETQPTIFATKKLIAHLQQHTLSSLPMSGHPESEGEGGSVLAVDAANGAFEPTSSTHNAPHATGAPPSFFPSLGSGSPEEDAAFAPKEVLLYADLHGHSRAHNIFMYGVAAAETTAAASPASVAASASAPTLNAASVSDAVPLPHRLSERVLAYLLSRRSPSFSESSCHFVVRKAKEGTARVVVARELLVQHSFTIEASFGGVCATKEQEWQQQQQANTAASAATLNGQQLPAPSPRTVGSSSSAAQVPSAQPVPVAPAALLPSSRYHGYHFSTRLYEEFGAHLCMALADLATPARYEQARRELERRYPPRPAPSPSPSPTPGAANTAALRVGAAAASDGGGDSVAEDTDDDEEAGEAEAALLRAKQRIRKKAAKRGGADAGGKKKKKSSGANKPRAASAARRTPSWSPSDDVDIASSSSGVTVSSSKRRKRHSKRHIVRSQSVERGGDASGSSAGLIGSSVLHGSTASDPAVAVSSAAQHVKRLLERLQREAEEEAKAEEEAEGMEARATTTNAAKGAATVLNHVHGSQTAHAHTTAAANSAVNESKDADEAALDVDALLLTGRAAFASSSSFLSTSIPTASVVSRARDVTAVVSSVHALPVSMAMTDATVAMETDPVASHSARPFRTRPPSGTVTLTASVSSAGAPELSEPQRHQPALRRQRSKARKGGKKMKAKSASADA